jgi:hypothetical protein
VTFSRATKLVAVFSTIVAAYGELHFTTPGWRALWPFTLGAAGVAAAGSMLARSIVTRVILAVIYLAPAAFNFIHGNDHPSYEISWLLPLLLLLVVDRRATDWSIPYPWRIPLAWWALVVSVSWPIVFLREVDFSRWLLGVERMPNSSGGTSPEDILLWTFYVVLGHNVGILWFDGLFRWYSRASSSGVGSRESGVRTWESGAFRKEVIVPLVTGAGIACLVGVYQATFDLNFLSGHVWPTMMRAAGTLMDANAFGMIVALMGPAAVALAMRQGTRASVTLSAIVLAITFSGVWTSGSRTALAALLVSTVAMAFAYWREITGRADAAVSRKPLIIGAVVAVAVVVLFVVMNSTIMTVYPRLHAVIPGLADTTVSSALRDLWQRNGYGSAAMRMIGEHPIEGVGPGIFHTLMMDYRTLVTDLFIGPDNAQNWIRHVVAEFGVLGAMPMLMWMVMFLRALVSKKPGGRDRFSMWAIASPLLALGLISMFSVPGQSLTVILTFWTLAFWYLLLSQKADRESGVGSRESNRGLWFAVVLLVLAHAGITYASARGSLLPRHRAERFGWNYTGGLYDLERNKDGTPGRRFTHLRSMATIPVKGKVLKFVAWIDHPDANEHPVRVRVRADGRDYFDGELKRPPESIQLDIPAQPGATDLILETWISRTFRPSQYDPNNRDRRDLGLSLRDWIWE